MLSVIIWVVAIIVIAIVFSVKYDKVYGALLGIVTLMCGSIVVLLIGALAQPPQVDVKEYDIMRAEKVLYYNIDDQHMEKIENHNFIAITDNVQKLVVREVFYDNTYVLKFPTKYLVYPIKDIRKY